VGNINYRNFNKCAAIARDLSTLSQEFQTRDAKLKVIMLVNTRIAIFWIVKPCTFIDR